MCKECPWGAGGAQPGAERGALDGLPKGCGEPCAAGTVDDDASTTTDCVRCMLGRFQPEPGYRTCDSCPAGSFSNVRGAISNDTCNSCEVGRVAAAPGVAEASSAPRCLSQCPSSSLSSAAFSSSRGSRGCGADGVCGERGPWLRSTIVAPNWFRDKGSDHAPSLN